MSTEQTGSRSTFEAAFEDAPVAIWHEDFSAVKAYLDHLPCAREEVGSYLEEKREAVLECVKRVRVRHVNRIAREFYGAETSEEMVKALPGLFDAPTLDVFRREVTMFYNGARSFMAEIDASTLHAERRLVQMNVSLVPTEADDWSNVVVTFSDLSKRRQFERSLELLNERLRRTNEGLEQFAYAAAHELREPLRTLALHTEVLKRLNANTLGPPAMEAFTGILNGTERMNELINDLLAFARTLEPAPTPLKAPIDSRAVVEDILNAMTASLSQVDARVEVGLMHPVDMDAAHLRQILHNLISNALKYRSPQRRAVIGINSNNEPTETRFCVSDNGPGIRKRYHEEIFGIFKRLHGRDIDGNGIGLALCKRIVEHYNGRIWVDSDEGTGARFYFTVPKSRLAERDRTASGIDAAGPS
jgi:signal transduction histidine kinase